MYLNLKKLNLVDNLNVIFAHRKANKKEETLEEHSNLTKKYLDALIDAKKLNNIIDGLLFSISKNHHNLLKKMFYNAVFLHDLGKINPSFQKNKMDNEHFEITTESSQHSLLSAEKYISIFKRCWCGDQ
jgi:CRISPR-associated endonuclease/helicase Cas3